MKKSAILMVFLFFLVQAGLGQKHKIELSHYLLPDFVEGAVLMKSGIKNKTSLNYNSLTEEMIFDTNGKKLALSKLDQIDTVFVGDRKFIPYEKKFIELLHQNKLTLFAIHRCSIIEPGKPAAYGGTTQTSSVTTVSSFYSNGQAYELKLPDDYEVRPFVMYILQMDGKMNQIQNIRQMGKLFDEKADQIKKFLKENKISYDDPDAMINLVKFIEQ